MTLFAATALWLGRLARAFAALPPRGNARARRPSHAHLCHRKSRPPDTSADQGWSFASSAWRSAASPGRGADERLPVCWSSRTFLRLTWRGHAEFFLAGVNFLFVAEIFRQSAEDGAADDF